MKTRCLVGCLLLMASVGIQTAGAQGIISPSAGALNRSMAGASTAAPLDAAGATYWNPASICDLRKTEVFVGVDFIYGDTFLESAVAASGQMGSNRSDSGLASVPAIGEVYRPEESLFRYGLGIHSLIGRTIDFPGSEFNPILKPWQPPKSFGVGPVSTNMSGLQITPILAYQLSDHLFVGGGPLVTSLSFSLDPALWAERNFNGTFPPATHSRPRWGFGLQFGVMYRPEGNWAYGGSFKSRQWFETFKFNSKTPQGVARTLELELSLPLILSGGVAYRGFERTLITTDIRYFNYANTKLFGESPEGDGLGWRNIWSIAAGVQYEANDMFKIQGGYAYNQNPIPETATIFNIQLPAINKNTISGGLTVAMTEMVDLAFSVAYSLRNTNQGTILEIPGTTVVLKQDLTAINLGFRWRL